MLILEIAAGIVLGALALGMLPSLLRGLDFLIGLLFLAVVVAAFAIFIALGWPYSLAVCLPIAGVVAGIWLLGWWSHNYMLMSEDEHRQFMSRQRYLRR
jgi:hypothetical protein